MNAIELDIEEGFQTFKINEKLIKVDVFEAMSKIRQSVKDRSSFPSQNSESDGVIKEVINYLEGIGFPKLSHTVALRIMKHLHSSAEEIKKI